MKETLIPNRYCFDTATIVEQTVAKLNQMSKRAPLTVGMIQHVCFNNNINSEHIMRVGAFFDSEAKTANKKHGKRYVKC